VREFAERLLARHGDAPTNEADARRLIALAK
jgi:hypothetical protein